MNFSIDSKFSTTMKKLRKNPQLFSAEITNDLLSSHRVELNSLKVNLKVQQEEIPQGNCLLLLLL